MTIAMELESASAMPTTVQTICDCREALFARALEIADEAMTELLCAHARRADEHGVLWALCDADGGEVAMLAEAGMALVEAVEWLRERKLCELVESPHGATVLLLSKIGEATLSDAQRQANRRPSERHHEARPNFGRPG